MCLFSVSYHGQYEVRLLDKMIIRKVIVHRKCAVFLLIQVWWGSYFVYGWNVRCTFTFLPISIWIALSFPRIVGVTDGVIAVWEKDFFSNISLTHYSPVLLFYIPWKHQKTFRWMLPSCRNQLREQKSVNLLNVIQDVSYVVLRKCQYEPEKTPYLDTFQAV